MVDEIKKPSFLGSVMSGLTGYIKGAVAGGVVGALLGAGIGAGLAALGLATGGVGLVAGMGALAFGATFSQIGGLAGSVTGVVRHREVLPTAADIVNVAKLSFAQGVSVGHDIGQSQHVDEPSTKWRDKVAQQRGQVVVAPTPNTPS